MNLTEMKPPFIRGETSVASMMRDMLFALTLLLALPVVRYGPRPAVAAALTVLVCVLCELLFTLMQTKTTGLSDGSAAVTGMVVALLLPVNAPLWLPCAAGAFAIAAAKAPFGSTGRNPFNPAAAGLAFAAVCWPQLVFSYAATGSDPLPLFGDCAVQTAPSPAAVLKQGLPPNILPFEMLWGNFAGPAGATAVLVVAACGLYLFCKRVAQWEITACFLLAVIVIAALFPRAVFDPLSSVKYELLSGSVLFCSVFMVTDPVTSPHTTAARCVYGLLSGALVMAFRWFGAYEQGAVFAVLLSNAAAPVLDDLVFRFRGWGGELADA